MFHDGGNTFGRQREKPLFLARTCNETCILLDGIIIFFDFIIKVRPDLEYFIKFGIIVLEQVKKVIAAQ